MDKEYLVYQNKVYSNFVNYINDYILLSKDPAMLKEGYVPYSSYVDDAGEGVYGKLVPYSEVSQRYSVYDRVLYKGQEFEIAYGENRKGLFLNESDKGEWIHYN